MLFPAVLPVRLAPCAFTRSAFPVFLWDHRYLYCTVRACHRTVLVVRFYHHLPWFCSYTVTTRSPLQTFTPSASLTLVFYVRARSAALILFPCVTILRKLRTDTCACPVTVCSFLISYHPSPNLTLPPFPSSFATCFHYQCLLRLPANALYNLLLLQPQISDLVNTYPSSFCR